MIVQKDEYIKHLQANSGHSFSTLKGMLVPQAITTELNKSNERIKLLEEQNHQ